MTAGDQRETVTATDREVWLLEVGCYETRCVAAVYVTAEAGIAANPPRVVPPDHIPSASNASRAGGWKLDDSGDWSNGLDWDEAARLTRHVVLGGTAGGARLHGGDLFTVPVRGQAPVASVASYLAGFSDGRAGRQYGEGPNGPRKR